MRYTTMLLTTALLAAGALPGRSAAQHTAAAHHASGPRATSGLATDLGEAVARVREATERFRSLQVAKAEGWTDQYPEGCAVSPDGAQAFHWLNPSLVDAENDLLRPELLMYEPQEDGSMELIGVDYIIPFEEWTGEEGPTLLGQPMMRNEPLGVWAIHIWAWRENPSGLFAPWNPDVSCANAR